MNIVFILFTILIIKINILPMKYLLIILLFLLLWDIILYFMLIFKVKQQSKKRKIIGYVVSGILFILMFLISYYLINTLGFFGNFNSNNYKKESYLVLVSNDSSYQSISDLKNIGYAESGLSNISKAKENILQKNNIEFILYDNYLDTLEKLYNKAIDSVLIEENYYTILTEGNKKYKEFKLLETIEIETELQHEVRDLNITKDTFTIYISGIDTYGSISSVSRSDVNIVLTVNPVTKQILLVSCPRDYYVRLRGTTGLKDKLTHAGIYGIENSIGTLEDLLEVEIDYYFRVNFSTLERVIDALDGVDVYSEYTFETISHKGYSYKFTKGYNHMNGDQALYFSRERYNLPGGDRQRGKNQQAVIDGIIRKLTSKAIITNYTSLLNSLESTFQTNLTDKNIQDLIKMQINDMATWNITSYSLNGTDSYNYTYSYPSEQLYVMTPIESTVNEAKSMIDKVYDSEILNGSYKKEVSDIKDPTVVDPNPIPGSNNSDNDNSKDDVLDETKQEQLPTDDINTEQLPNEDNSIDEKPMEENPTDDSINEEPIEESPTDDSIVQDPIDNSENENIVDEEPKEDVSDSTTDTNIDKSLDSSSDNDLNDEIDLDNTIIDIPEDSEVIEPTIE